jgi:hypothetical protein
MQELLALDTSVHLPHFDDVKQIYLWYDTDHFISGVVPAKTKVRSVLPGVPCQLTAQAFVFSLTFQHRFSTSIQFNCIPCHLTSSAAMEPSHRRRPDYVSYGHLCPAMPPEMVFVDQQHHCSPCASFLMYFFVSYTLRSPVFMSFYQQLYLASWC